MLTADTGKINTIGVSFAENDINIILALFKVFLKVGVGEKLLVKNQLTVKK